MLLTEGDRGTLGSKGFDLCRCRLLGVEVPDFVVVPTRFHAMAVEDREPERAIAMLRQELRRALSALGGSVAVRSSSVAEDLHGSSNAGRFRTVLGVDGLPALEAAIAEVWGSAGAHPMAVIIQRMLDPDIAGVLFTRDPVTGADTSVVEYVDGLADGLVSGRRDPVRRVVPNDLVPADDRFRELLLASRRLEEGFGHPLDIEWAMCGERLHILQARPITNLPPPPPGAGPSYSRVHAEEFFSGPVTPIFYSIFNDLYSRFYVGETLEALGVERPSTGPVLVRHRNYLYVDTALQECALSQLPSGLGGGRLREMLPPDVVEGLSRDGRKGMGPSSLVRGIGFVLLNPRLWITNLDRHFKEVVVPDIVRRLDTVGDPRKMDLEGLGELYMELVDVTALHIRTSKWGLALYSILLSEVMGDFLERNGIGRERLSDLMTDLEGNMTLDASRELGLLAELIRGTPGAVEAVREARPCYDDYRDTLTSVPRGGLVIDTFESILVRFGHRRLSRDLISPSWRDDPMIPFGIVRDLVLSDTTEGRDRAPRGADRRAAAQRDIEGRLPFVKRRVFRTLARYLARYTAFRELQRFYLDMILSRMRGWVLEVSRRMVGDGVLGEPDDVFFLLLADVMGYLSGRPMAGLDRRARFEMLSYHDGKAMPGRYLRGRVDYDSVGRRPPAAEAGPSMSGQAVSAGVYSGRVRVVQDIDGMTEVSHGDVVVTRCLDPGQTHFLMMAGALILEVGGMLSHGAILARELGVPTVAQVRDATGILRDGQMVVVDGTRGTVMIGP